MFDMKVSMNRLGVFFVLCIPVSVYSIVIVLYAMFNTEKKWVLCL